MHSKCRKIQSELNDCCHTWSTYSDNKCQANNLRRIHITIRHSFSLHVYLDDGTETMKAMLTDGFMKKLSGTRCEKLVLIDGYDKRKIIPTELEQHKTKVLKFHLEMSKKSHPNKINFVVVDLQEEPLPESPNTTSTAAKKHTLSITSVTTTPTPVGQPSTPTTNTPEKTKSPPSTTQKKPHLAAAKRLTYEASGDIDVINPTKRSRYKD